MKNIKNTIAAMSLMAVLGLGATTANAGLMMSDFSGSPSQPTCSKTETGIFDQLTGILIVGFTSSLTGILLGDRQAPCVQSPAGGVTNDGILIVG